MTWEPDQVGFQSYYGKYDPNPPAEDVIEAWVFTGDKIPLPGDEKVRMNLWLVGGQDPAGDQDIEVVISDFRYLSDINIPTVSGWAMLALGLLILVGGTIVIGRRRHLFQP